MRQFVYPQIPLCYLLHLSTDEAGSDRSPRRAAHSAPREAAAAHRLGTELQPPSALVDSLCPLRSDALPCSSPTLKRAGRRGALMSAHAPPSSPPALHSSGNARSFLIVCQSIAHALAYRRLGGAKQTGSLKAVQQRRQGEDAVLTYGTLNVLREMDLRHPAALLVQELIEGHHRAFGMGCTTLVAWIGLFASAFADLLETQSLRPATVAATLAEIRVLLAATLDWPSSTTAATSSTDSIVLPLTQLIDQHRAAQLAASPSAAAPIVPSQPSADDDDVDWFFDSAAPSAAASASAAPLLPLALLPPDPLFAFLSSLGSSLAHGQDAAMAAAVAVMLRLLRGEGVSDLDALRRAMEGEQDLTQEWDLSGMIQTQTRIGPAPSSSSAAAAPPRSSASSTHLLPQDWELVEGVLLDLFAPEVGPVRSALKRLQTTLPSSSSAAAAAAASSASAAPPMPVGLVLVLGDVSLPEDQAARSVPRSSSSSSSSHAGSASATEIIKGVLQRHKQRSDAFVARLLSRLRSLGVSLILAKGSFNPLLLTALRAAGIICLETVNYPVLEGASRVGAAPMVCELSEITAVHVGRANVQLKSIGWNASLAHKHVSREIGEGSGGEVEAKSEWKIVLGPEAAAVSGASSSATAAPLSPLTLFSSHSTVIHSRVFTVSFWNCLHRLRAALKDRCVLRGAGAVERRWAGSMERRSVEIEAEIARKLVQLPSAHLDDSLVHSLALHRAVATVWRNYLHLLARNSGELSEEQSWVAAASGSDDASASDGSPRYDTRSSALSALSTCLYLFSVFPHLDATLLCAHGRTVYQLLDGHRDASGHSVRIL